MVAGVGKVVGAPLRLGAAFAVFALLAGCMQAPRARSIIGPDGTRVLHVACDAADQGACFELAGRSCPYGYALTPTFQTRSNNYLVRCENRAPGLAPLMGSPTPRSPSLPSSWPPPSEIWPPTDPWSQTVTGGPLTEAARLPNGQVDIGY